MSAFRLAGVMGWPVGHSRSPVLHGHWLARHGIAGAYVPLPVRPADLEQALRALPVLGFAGVNLTVPHKEAGARLVDHLDPAAARLGSINTVLVRPDGSLEGRSTDGYGFIRNLREGTGWQPGRGAVALLGAGGAARAIAAALIEAGETEVRIANRTDAKAAELAAPGSAIKPWPWAERGRALADCHLLINTTSLGMTGQPPLELDLAMLPGDAIVTDIVYVPLETSLLAEARRRGNPTLDGLGMLLHQAAPAFAGFFGTMPTVDAALRMAVLATFA
ncbi:MAG TPA: shikimate dehydrogenase [Aliidongia sp.]|nr:shikimate dehydrogenase [Aliidongia sp.]